MVYILMRRAFFRMQNNSPNANMDSLLQKPMNFAEFAYEE